MKNFIIIASVILFLLFMYRSCTVGYEKYGYFVHAKNEAVFKKALSDSDPNIVERGRALLEKIVQMDQRIDKNDGQHKGLLRWYVCSGIDCDEGWQRSFEGQWENTQKSGATDMNNDDFTQEKIKAYNQYDPSKAKDDAVHDIAQQSTRLFYIDISEAPEVLVIDDRNQALPSHKKIYIGTGCTDNYNAQNGPSAYRSAMDRALWYGRQYNTVIAKHYKLRTKSDTLKAMNATQQFIGPERSDWDRAKIELDDIQPLFGGRHIWIDCGSGHLTLRAVRPDQQQLEQKNHVYSLDKNDLDRLVKTFIEHDFLSLKSTDKKGLPDQATPKIILENTTGGLHSVWNWDPPVKGGDESADRRFQAIYRAILRLETKVMEANEPLCTYPYTG